MGFVPANTLPTLREHKRLPWSGHALCLGQADVYFDGESLAAMAVASGVTLRRDVALELSHRPDLAAKGYLSRNALFASLGFSQVSALDVSAFEGAEFQFDLNSSVLPDALKGKFDAIFDHGTMEHVFHVPNFLANVFGMLKEGGRVVHTNPTSNHVDHGFYMFSPTFFHDFYTANEWDIRAIQLVRVHPERQETDPPFFADYAPGALDRLSAGGLEGAYVTACVAQKGPASTGNRIPQQGHYRRTANWSVEEEPLDLKELRLTPPFAHEEGNCWTIELPVDADDGDSARHPQYSVTRVRENGASLGPPHSQHAAVRQAGSGAFSHWNRHLYFSSSDNSDPNTNGRAYTARVRLRS